MKPCQTPIKHGMTNTLALPIDKMYITYCVHTLNTKKICSSLNGLNIFTKETSSPNVKSILIRENFQKLDPMWVIPVARTGPKKTNTKNTQCKKMFCDLGLFYRVWCIGFEVATFWVVALSNPQTGFFFNFQTYILIEFLKEIFT